MGTIVPTIFLGMVAAGLCYYIFRKFVPKQLGQPAAKEATAPQPTEPSKNTVERAKALATSKIGYGVLIGIAVLIAMFFVWYLVREYAPKGQGGASNLPDLSNYDIIVSIGIITILAIGAMFGKFGKAGKLALVAAGVGLVLLGPSGTVKLLTSIQNTVKETAEGGVKFNTTSNAPTVPQAPAYGARGTVAEARITWAQPNADGTLPVGVWSEPFRIPIGCVLHTDGGNGITFLMEYRWEHERGWNRLQPKQQDAPGNLVRLMILEAARGVKNPPVSIKC